MISASQNLANLTLALVASVTLFGILWARDYPKPHQDDLYYTGAALHMATGGDFSNPLIERQENPSHFFFVYPPLHSFTLAGWLKTFGISSRSMTGFQLLMAAVTAVSGIIVLWRHKAPTFMLWLVPLGVTSAFLPAGLRSEPISVVLTMAGLALAECGFLNVLVIYLSFVLIFLGASAAPRLVMFSAVLAAYSAWKLISQTSGAKRTATLVSLAFALITASAIFLVQIHCDVTGFWNSFHTHAKLVDRRKIDMLVLFMDGNEFIDGLQLPAIWALGWLALFAWRRPMCESTRLGLVLVLGFFLEAAVGGLGACTFWYVLLALLLIASAVMKNSPALASKIAFGLVFLFLLSNAQYMVFEYQRAAGRVTFERGEAEKAALEMHSTAEHPVLIGSSVARYVYDYRIPEGFLDIGSGAPFPKQHVIQQWQPNDIYVVGPADVEILDNATSLRQPIQKRVVFGLPRHQIVTHPCLVYIIPADKCEPKR